MWMALQIELLDTFSFYFKVRNCDNHHHKIRNNNDLILDKLNLECTKRAFFYKGAIFLNNS